MAYTTQMVPLYIAVCLKCKNSHATPSWTSASSWQQQHIGQAGHTVVMAQGAIHTDFVTTLSDAESAADDQPVPDAVAYEQTGARRG
jgi:hypothetical protein